MIYDKYGNASTQLCIAILWLNVVETWSGHNFMNSSRYKIFKLVAWQYIVYPALMQVWCCFPAAKMSCFTPKRTMITTKYWLFLWNVDFDFRLEIDLLMLLLFLNCVTVDFLIKFMFNRASRVDKSLVHEISRSFLSRSTLSVKKKGKNFQSFSREAHSFRDFLIPLSSCSLVRSFASVVRTISQPISHTWACHEQSRSSQFRKGYFRVRGHNFLPPQGFGRLGQNAAGAIILPWHAATSLLPNYDIASLSHSLVHYIVSISLCSNMLGC